LLPLSDGRLIYEKTAISGNEPWIADASGERLVRDIDMRTSGAGISACPTLNDGLFFYASNSGGGVNLWTSGGTPESTTLAVDPSTLGPGHQMQSTGNIALNGRLLFATSFFDPTNHYSNRLFSSDGTTAGTTLLQDYTGAYSPCCSTPLISNLSVVGNEAWFSLGNQIYRTPGTPGGGVQLITSRVPAIQISQRAGAGMLYSYNSASSTRTVWYCDGTDAGTRQIWSYPTSGISIAFNAGSTAYITSSSTSPSIDRLYATEGDTPRLLLDNISYNSTRFIGDLGGGDALFFASPVGGTSQLYRATGRGMGVLSLGPLRFPCGSSGDSALLDGVVYFSASLSTSDAELWRTDGTPAGTYRLADLLPGTGSSCPHNFFSDGQHVWFTATTGTNVSEVWQTDGTPTGTTRIAALPRAGSGTQDPAFLGATAAGLFFLADNPTLGRELHLYHAGQPDCNHNFIHDREEVALGLATDSNADGRPDVCCPADFNSDAVVSIPDIFEFLNAWFAGDPATDFNHSGAFEPLDILDFLTAWFTPCSVP
jgi:ELWxxDGT repeat protein